jgi:hypothetical protein
MRARSSTSCKVERLLAPLGVQLASADGARVVRRAPSRVAQQAERLVAPIGLHQELREAHHEVGLARGGADQRAIPATTSSSLPDREQVDDAHARVDVVRPTAQRAPIRLERRLVVPELVLDPSSSASPRSLRRPRAQPLGELGDDLAPVGAAHLVVDLGADPGLRACRPERAIERLDRGLDLAGLELRARQFEQHRRQHTVVAAERLEDPLVLPIARSHSRAAASARARTRCGGTLASPRRALEVAPRTVEVAHLHRELRDLAASSSRAIRSACSSACS